MSFLKLPKGACGGLLGLGWLSIFGGTSHELEQGRVGAFGLFICLF